MAQKAQMKNWQNGELNSKDGIQTRAGWNWLGNTINRNRSPLSNRNSERLV